MPKHSDLIAYDRPNTRNIIQRPVVSPDRQQSDAEYRRHARVQNSYDVIIIHTPDQWRKSGSPIRLIGGDAIIRVKVR